MPSIYLDNNATTTIDRAVAEHIHQLNLAGVANPSSQHQQGRQALKILEAAKLELLESIGAQSVGMGEASVFWTSGGTEANNLAVLGRATAKPGTIIVAATEHPSVLEAARKSMELGCEVLVLEVDSNGRCNLAQLEQWLAELGQGVSLVSVMLGNNETGVVQDLKAICAICAPHGVPVHSDIVQAVGKTPFNMLEMGLSAVTLTAHKIHGPVGIGALITHHDLSLQPMLVGGGQQLSIRPGTVPTIAASGLAMSVQQTKAALADGTYAVVAAMRDRFEQAVCANTKAFVIGAESERLPHTSNIGFLGLERQALQMALDLRGIACSTGSACASGSSRPSPVLAAMNLPEEVSRGSLRFSLSKYTNQSEMDSAIEVVCSVVQKLQSSRV